MERFPKMDSLSVSIFSKQSAAEVATKTAAAKLSNGTALVVKELAQEPAKGLLHVVTHVQKSVPGLLEAHKGLEAATAQLQAVLAELQDAQEGVISVTSPATQQDMQQLAASIHTMQKLHEEQQQLQQQQEQLRQQSGQAHMASGAPLTENEQSNKAGPGINSGLVYKLWRTSAGGGTKAAAAAAGDDSRGG